MNQVMDIWRLWISYTLLSIEGHSGLTIGGCKHGSADVTNGTNPSFTCTSSLSNTLTWNIYNEQEEQIFSVSCSKWMCTSRHNRFNLLVNDSSSSFTSKLRINEITKDSARRLVCVTPSGQAECSLRIIETEQETDSSSIDGKGGLIGGVVTALIVIAIIGTVITVYTVKHRKGKCGRERFTLKYWSSPCNYFHQRRSQPCAAITKPVTQTPIKRFAASSGDIYTVAFSTTSGEVSDEPATIYETVETTMLGVYENYNFPGSKAVCKGTEVKEAANLTTNCKSSIASTRKLQDLDAVYMNVTEVPTDSD